MNNIHNIYGEFDLYSGFPEYTEEQIVRDNWDVLLERKREKVYKYDNRENYTGREDERSVMFYAKKYEAYNRYYESVRSRPHCFSEVKLARVWQHARFDDGFIMISAFRDENEQHENMELHRQLKKDIKRYGLGYFVVDGHYIENEGKPNERDVDELVYFIPYTTKHHSIILNPREFEELAIKLRDKYGQDGVLIKVPGEKNVYELKDNDTTINRGLFRPDRIGDLWSKLKYGPHRGRTFIFEGVQTPGSFMGAGGFIHDNQIF